MTTDNKGPEYWIERCLLQLRDMNKVVQDINDGLRQRRQELIQQAEAANYHVYHCTNCGRHVAQVSEAAPLCTCSNRMIRSDNGDGQ
jgi:hypothetical protein